MRHLVVIVAVAVMLGSAVAQHWGGYGHGGYHGALAAPVVTHDGFLADTPEVAAAKSAHFQELARASSHGGGLGYSGARYGGGYAHGGYHGPLASPVITHDGFLADTPEVAAAKAKHLSLLNEAHQGSHGGSYGGYGGAYNAYGGDHASYDDGGHYDDASNYDDGSYKPHLYESAHY